MSSSQSSEWPSFLLFVVIPIVLAGLLVVFVRRVRRLSEVNRWTRLLVGNTLVFGFLLSLSFVIMEAWFRFGRDTTDSFNHSKISQRWFTKHYMMNNFSMRDNILYSPRIASGKRRITVLGDSFTVGQGIANVEDRFANILRRTMPDTEVHVLAVPGFDTGAQYEMISDMITNNYQVDIVLLAYCLNDIGDLSTEWAATMDGINKGQASAGWLRRNSYFFDTLMCRWEAMRNPNIRDYYGELRKTYGGPEWDKQRVRLQAIQKSVTAAKGRFGVVTFPFFHSIGPDYAWKGVHEQLDDFWKQSQVPNCDLLSVYQGRKPSELMVNKYDAHPNELAHRLAAEAIVKFFQQPQAQSAPGPQSGD